MTNRLRCQYCRPTPCSTCASAVSAQCVMRTCHTHTRTRPSPVTRSVRGPLRARVLLLCHCTGGQPLTQRHQTQAESVLRTRTPGTAGASSLFDAMPADTMRKMVPRHLGRAADAMLRLTCRREPARPSRGGTAVTKTWYGL